MWDRIKRLWQQQHTPALTLSQDEQQAQVDFFWQELHAQRLDGLEEKVRPLLASQYPAIAQKALRILGLEQFHQHQYAKAWPLFEKLAEQTQTATDWFNVVTSATLAGEIERGSAAFDNAVKSHNNADETQQPSVAMMHHFYACALRDAKAYELAFEHVQVLRAIYEKLPSTSPAQLELRGLPPLENVLEMFVDVLAQSGDIPEAITWLQEFGHQLDAPGRAQVIKAIERLKSLERSAPAKSPDDPA